MRQRAGAKFLLKVGRGLESDAPMTHHSNATTMRTPEPHQKLLNYSIMALTCESIAAKTGSSDALSPCTVVVDDRLPVLVCLRSLCTASCVI